MKEIHYCLKQNHRIVITMGWVEDYQAFIKNQTGTKQIGRIQLKGHESLMLGTPGAVGNGNEMDYSVDGF